MQWPFLQIQLMQSSTGSTSNQCRNRPALCPHQYEERTHCDHPIHQRVCSTWLASCLLGCYVICSLHPHPNLAQNSISASDPLIETVKQRVTATIFIDLDTAFSTLWVGHLYKLHKFLHFNWWKPDPCIFAHGRIRYPLNQPNCPRMARSLEWVGLD
jgi:hypothetical protein